MAAVHSGSSVSRFRLIGVIHAFFKWKILSLISLAIQEGLA
jgi:hypothetical protein